MPIRPENKHRYPANWSEIALSVKESACWECEWCGAHHGVEHPKTGATVILTVAHLDHTPENCDRANLKALCQKCHNGYDAPHRAAGIKRRKLEKLNSAHCDLFNDNQQQSRKSKEV